jgi:hypothetical protein
MPYTFAQTFLVTLLFACDNAADHTLPKERVLISEEHLESLKTDLSNGLIGRPQG